MTKKITMAAARIKAARQKELALGNLEARRDWGYAKEYVEAMPLMLQQERPDDYVLATNQSHSIRDFLEAAFGQVGLEWQAYVKFDPRLMRPAEAGVLVGDYTKARQRLGWSPHTLMPALAKLMVEADLDQVAAG